MLTGAILLILGLIVFIFEKEGFKSIIFELLIATLLLVSGTYSFLKQSIKNNII